MSTEMDDPLQWANIAVESLIQRSVAGSRFTQDSPVLPDVWMRYGAAGGRQDLLLVPSWKSSAALLAAQLGKRLYKTTQKGADPRSAEIALHRARSPSGSPSTSSYGRRCR